MRGERAAWALRNWSPSGWLDLDHIRAEIAEDLRRQRPEDDGREIDDTYPVEGSLAPGIHPTPPCILGSYVCPRPRYSGNRRHRDPIMLRGMRAYQTKKRQTARRGWNDRAVWRNDHREDP